MHANLFSRKLSKKARLLAFATFDPIPPFYIVPHFLARGSFSFLEIGSVKKWGKKHTKKKHGMCWRISLTFIHGAFMMFLLSPQVFSPAPRVLLQDFQLHDLLHLSGRWKTMGSNGNLFGLRAGKKKVLKKNRLSDHPFKRDPKLHLW